MKQIRRQNM